MAVLTTPGLAEVVVRSSDGVIGLDGGDLRQLTAGLAGQFDDRPVWSPDGTTIAFSRASVDPSDPSGLRSVLMTVDVDGGETRELTSGVSGDDLAPAWSPDGSSLAFVRRANGAAGADDRGVWVVAVDGTGERHVAEVAGATTISWHPQGSSLLVSADRLQGGAGFLVDVDGGDAERLDVATRLATWSPDGARVWFLVETRVDRGIVWMLATGELRGAALAILDRTDVGAGFLYPYFGLDVGPCG